MSEYQDSDGTGIDAYKAAQWWDERAPEVQEDMACRMWCSEYFMSYRHAKHEWDAKPQSFRDEWVAKARAEHIAFCALHEDERAERNRQSLAMTILRNEMDIEK